MRDYSPNLSKLNRCNKFRGRLSLQNNFRFSYWHFNRYHWLRRRLCSCPIVYLFLEISGEVGYRNFYGYFCLDSFGWRLLQNLSGSCQYSSSDCFGRWCTDRGDLWRKTDSEIQPQCLENLVWSFVPLCFFEIYLNFLWHPYLMSRNYDEKIKNEYGG